MYNRQRKNQEEIEKLEKALRELRIEVNKELPEDKKKNRLVANEKIGVGYIRVSTEMQAKDGFSLENQKERIIEYCEKKGIKLIELYEDKGESAGTLNRPGIQKLLNELEDGTNIIFYDVQRMTRDVIDFRNLLKMFKEKLCPLHIVCFPFDTSTIEGMEMLEQQVQFGERERKMISYRVGMVMDNLVRKGELRTKPKYGYMVVEETIGTKKIKKMVENPKEQKVLNYIKLLLSNDPTMSVTAIKKKLEEERIQITRKPKSDKNAYVVHYIALQRIIQDNNLRPE